MSETHTGVLFAVGNEMYKLKKPVDLGFVDFTDRRTRQLICHREVELNRRLAPDVYLGVADLVGPDGQPFDHLVVMRRLPAECSLAALIEAGQDVTEHLRDIARRLAEFHSRAERSSGISAQGSTDAAARRWRVNLDTLRRHPGIVDPELTNRIGRLALRYLQGRGPLFDDRIGAERVVDGHGDLLTADVFCLEDGPRILDCLEFDDRLRWVDAIDDAAFLAMDLHHQHRPDLAEYFLDQYRQFAADPAPASLQHHYIAYRATVRAVVRCVRADQTSSRPNSAHHSNSDGADPSDDDRIDACAHAELALHHLRHGAVRLVLVGGLPGTGKSTIAAHLADHLEAVLIGSDQVRNEIHPVPDTGGRGPAARYTPEAIDQVYRVVCDRASLALTHGETVVLDASWTRAQHRRYAFDLAGSAHADVIALRCHTDPHTAAARLRSRGPSHSDADEEVAAAMATDADPWPQATDLDTTGSETDTLRRALILAQVPALTHPDGRESHVTTSGHPQAR